MLKTEKGKNCRLDLDLFQGQNKILDFSFFNLHSLAKCKSGRLLSRHHLFVTKGQNMKMERLRCVRGTWYSKNLRGSCP